jgi:hypothetical protein
MLTLGGLHESHAVDTNSAFAQGPRKTTENLDRVDRSQDLPSVYCLVASI